MVDGLPVPLNVDAYTQRTLAMPNQPPLSSSLGTLDAAGEAAASFSLPPGSQPSLVGLSLNHAFVLVGPLLVEYASNAMPLSLLP